MRPLSEYNEQTAPDIPEVIIPPEATLFITVKAAAAPAPDKAPACHPPVPEQTRTRRNTAALPGIIRPNEKNDKNADISIAAAPEI